MPTNTFFNLPNEKKQKLLSAAKGEFTRVPFVNASINKIIQEAGIPRGSFYMYFENKEDLYFYLLIQYRDLLLDRLLFLLEENNGELIEVFQKLYQDVIKYCNHTDEKQYLKNIILNMNMHIENNLFRPFHPSIDFDLKRKQIKSCINMEKYSLDTSYDLDDVIALLLQLMIHHIIPVLLLECPVELAEKRYYSQLSLLERGFIKRGD